MKKPEIDRAQSLMKRPMILAVTLGMLASSAAFVPTAMAGSCKETDSGWGKESPTCGFSCKRGDTIEVAVASSSGGFVSGDAGCGNGTAHCDDADGGCSHRGTQATVDSKSGSCRGYGGKAWNDWTRVTVWCDATAPRSTTAATLSSGPEPTISGIIAHAVATSDLQTIMAGSGLWMECTPQFEFGAHFPGPETNQFNLVIMTLEHDGSGFVQGVEGMVFRDGSCFNFTPGFGFTDNEVFVEVPY